MASTQTQPGRHTRPKAHRGKQHKHTTGCIYAGLITSIIIIQLVIQVSPETMIVLTSAENIYLMNATSGNTVALTSLRQEMQYFHGICYNWKMSTLFITAANETRETLLLSYNINTRMLHTKRVPNHSIPTRIAADVTSATVYYTARAKEEVVVTSADFAYTQILMTSLTDVHGLVLDQAEGMLFVTIFPKIVSDPGSIISAHMDGKNRKTIVSENITSPYNIDIDRATKTLYWIDFLEAKLEKCAYDGTMRETIFTFVGVHPISLTLDDTLIYIAIFEDRKLYSVPKTGGALKTLVGPTSSSIQPIDDMDVISAALQLSVDNGCSRDNGNCQQLCLPTPNGRRCACDEKFVVAVNGMDCLEAKFEKVLLVVDTHPSGIYVVDVETGAYKVEGLFNLMGPRGISWDWKNKTFFWAEQEDKSISRACLHPHKCASLVAEWPDSSDLEMEGLAVDPVKEHIYVVDSFLPRILRLGYWNATETVIHDLGVRSPRALALDLNHRLIFWTEVTPLGQICKSPMEPGSTITTIVTTGNGILNDVVLDPERKLVYWCDGRRLTIEMCDYDGKHQKILYQASTIVLSIAIGDGYLYFSDKSSHTLYRIDQMTGKHLKAIGMSIFHEPYKIIFVCPSPCGSMAAVGPSLHFKPESRFPLSMGFAFLLIFHYLHYT